MKPNYIYFGLVVLIIVGLLFVRTHSTKKSNLPLTPYDVFGQCLADAGAKFYGAYWCQHCQDQKKLLGNSKKIPYIECSTPNGNAQLQICIDEKITGYPTWKFADGSVADGNQTLEQLSTKTNCALPAT